MPASASVSPHPAPSRLSEAKPRQTPVICPAMRRTALLLLMCALCAAPGAALARRHAHLSTQKPPVVVELFTAQGCSSCGKANAFVVDLAERPGVLALT